MRGSLSSAATKCISLVPGLVKQTSMPASASVVMRAWAPFMGVVGMGWAPWVFCVCNAGGRGGQPPVEKVRAAERAVRMQPGKNVPSSERLPLAPPPPNPAASPTAYKPGMG